MENKIDKYEDKSKYMRDRMPSTTFSRNDNDMASQILDRKYGRNRVFREDKVEKVDEE